MTDAQGWVLLGLGASMLAVLMTLLVRFLDARFDAVGARFDAVDRRFAAVDARFDAVDARFTGLERRLDGLDRDVHMLVQRAVGGDPD